ncbi:AMP-binding protein [Desulfovibrio mangrovi]|uniref:AMP-binding protein n=1 Tax=Desulfovibrio mangrovi TaxID=2976983 RepID=UPI002248150E|nr:AMP-binding protein [Desulfovibrio mangrovi]UZP68123.1 AMP-binding protein [Desulfovibrio mangrovi]
MAFHRNDDAGREANTAVREAEQVQARKTGQETPASTNGTPEHVEDLLLRLVRELVAELHPKAADRPVHLDHSIDRDLGLDSLARMELLTRVENAFGVTLPERTFTDAESPRDLLRAISRLRTAATPAHAADQPAGDSLVPAKKPEETERPDAVPHNARTLVDVIEWHVTHHPDRLHIRFYKDKEEGDTLSFHQLKEGADAVARGLQHLDIKPAEPVAIMLPTGPDYFFTFLGILLAGGIPVPLYPPVRQARLEDHLRRHRSILQNCAASTLVSMPEAKPFARLLKSQVESLHRIVTVEELSSDSGAFWTPQVNPQDTAFLQYTSGSTGNPKGVVLSHANLLANIRAMGQNVQATPNDVFVSWLPLYHDMGLIGAWLGSLYFGSQLVIMSPIGFLTRPLRWFQAVHRYRGSITASPNFGFELCLRKVTEEDLRELDLSSLRAVCNGAEPVSAETVRRLIERFSVCGLKQEAVMPVYGLAECSVGLTFPPTDRGPLIDRVQRETFQRDGLALPADADDDNALQFVSSGSPLTGHEVRIVDDAGRELPERRVGQLHFRGPSATSGYFRNPEQTGKLFRDGWLDSGDLAYMVCGDVFITGRIKDIIIRAGRNITPEELEEAIGKVQGIRKSCVAVFGSHTRGPDSSPAPGTPPEADATSDMGTERLVVLAETRESSPETREQIIAEINSLAVDLAGTPADEVLLVPPGTVLKTSSGKVRRAASKERYEQGRLGRPAGALWLILARQILSSMPQQLRRARRALSDSLFAFRAWSLYVILATLGILSIIALPALSWRWTALHTLARLLGLSTGTRLMVRGLENLPTDRPCVIVANHASYLDGYVLAATLPHPVSFVAKAELAANAALRFLMQRVHTEFVERFDMQKGIEDARRISRQAKAGRILMYFAEGTFTRAPGLRPFHMGAFIAAAESGAPVVPIAIRGTRSMLRADSWFPRRGSITVTIGKPIEVQPTGPEADGASWNTAVELRNIAREFILRHCGDPDLGSAGRS